MSIVRRDHLPPLLKSVADAVGVPATMAMLEAFGGSEVHIPRNPAEGSRLVDLVGLEAAARLAWVIGPGGITMPLCRPILTAWLHGEGLTAAEIARRLKVTNRTVRRYLAAPLLEDDRPALYSTFNLRRTAGPVQMETISISKPANPARS